MNFRKTLLLIAALGSAPLFASNLTESFYIKYFGSDGSGTISTYTKATEIIKAEGLKNARAVVKEVNGLPFIYIRIGRFLNETTANTKAKDLKLKDFYIMREVK